MTAARVLDWTPSAVVFDCDGTLMDTELHWQEARDLVLRGYGVAPDAGFATRAKGLHYTECGRLMAEVAGEPAQAEPMTAHLLDAFRKLVADDPATMPGAAALVRRVADFAPLAVASNCPLDVVESCLEGAGLLSYFAHVVVPGDDVLPKPAPDVYLTAAALCGAEPADSLAVEDSYCGIRAAGRAGLRILGVGAHPSEEEAAAVDLWVPDLAEPGLVDWAKSRRFATTA
ncbi:HAD family hydrolase [Kitasatospora sp. NBC_00315]|uniref:HAD family hydrolase n=1 Tax=Kitasatospora sp. NBC_00315 TaxID=2975963 RepID=UPI00324EA1B1